tara:strand:- start:567 stop:860 length:294 start_codon:yes stop_codon:yes gene_type:complete
LLGLRIEKLENRGTNKSTINTITIERIKIIWLAGYIPESHLRSALFRFIKKTLTTISPIPLNGAVLCTPVTMGYPILRYPQPTATIAIRIAMPMIDL